MLEALTDFWKPAKKTAPQEKLQPELLQVGSSIGFGFVPQANLSGRRLDVTAINTYQFGNETLTSFVLDKDPGVSMIVAESEGEQYLAISRRIPINDRMKLFDTHDLENIISKADITKLPCKDNIAEYKSWVVASYKREIQGLKGRIFKGDFRKKPLPGTSEAQEFDYTLLVSESNEHAIEIEKYTDGRIEVYATIYRRMNDVGEITHPVAGVAVNEMSRPDVKLASAPATPATPASPMMSSAPKPVEAPKAAEPVKKVEPARPVEMPKAAEPAKPTATTPPVIGEAKPAPIKLQELAPTTQTVAAPAPIITAIKPAAPAEVKPEPVKTVPSTPSQEAKPAMATNGTTNPTPTTESPKLYVQPTAPESFMKQEVKAVTNTKSMSSYDADAIECDLRVANKIIDEAIRNEMRLTDIVRRIIELPVAYPESVQIPVQLTDEDYALLAIRYGIPSSDRNAIKRRIIEDLNDFSGNTAKKLAA